jgi:TPR repeat protein
MRDANKDRLEIRRFKKQLRVGSSTAANNIAATYRKLGNARRAFHWWRRTAGPHDGDAWLEVGYCLQYGIGTRRDAAAAMRAYRKAVASDHTTESGREEAQYHLAVALVDRDDVRSHREVERLLNQAAQDGDYPQATQLLARLAERQPLRVCRCRRGLARRLGGKTHCPLHRRAVTVPQRGSAGPLGR